MGTCDKKRTRRGQGEETSHARSLDNAGCSARGLVARIERNERDVKVPQREKVDQEKRGKMPSRGVWSGLGRVG